MKNWQWNEKKLARLLAIYGGDKDALQLAKCITLISHFYDDLIDRDKPLDDAAIHAGMWQALIELPANPFYCTHIKKLWPLMAGAIFDYRASNDLAKLEEPPRAREIANVTRFSLAVVLIFIAGLCGGQEHAGAYAGEIRLMAQDDALREWLEEVTSGETQAQS